MGVGNYDVKIKLWENGRVMGVLTVITVVMVTIIFLLCELPSFRTHPTSLPSADPEVTRLKRDVSETSDPCLSHYGGIEVDYIRGSTTAFTFDLCSVIKSGEDRSSWRNYEIWTCHDSELTEFCLLGRPTDLRRSQCPDWVMVTAYTGPGWEPSRGWKGFEIQRDYGNRLNPITMSIGGWRKSPQWYGRPDKVFYFLLGVEVSGKDPMGVIKINFKDPPGNASTTASTTVRDTPSVSKVMQVDYTKLKPRQLMSRATRYVDSSLAGLADRECKRTKCV